MVKSPTTVLPIMCLRSGGLPLPDITERLLNQMGIFLHIVNAYCKVICYQYFSFPPFYLYICVSASDFILNGDIGASLNLQSAVHCFPFRKTLKLNLTNEQVRIYTYFYTTVYVYHLILWLFLSFLYF